MRIYDRGIRRRLAPMMQGNRRRIELAYSLQFTMPGTPVLRYGEEIGMGEDLALPGRESIRTPMQWDDGAHRRVLDRASSAARAPGARRAPHSRRERSTCEQQRRDKDSLLRWFENLIDVLRECPEIGVGTPQVVDVALPRSVLAHRFDAPQGSILLLHNLADTAATIDLSGVETTPSAHQVFGDTDYEPLPKRLAGLRLNGYGYCWIRLHR